MTQQNQIAALNMTNFFNRELMMYSFGDIKFKKPISLKAIAWTLGFLIVWTLPLFLAFGLPLDPVRLVIYFGVPIGLGQLAVRPIFGDKTLVDFVKTAFIFLGEPRGWADLKPFDPKAQVFTTEHEIWISRRREYQLLADMIEEELPRRANSSKTPKKSKEPKKKKK